MMRRLLLVMLLLAVTSVTKLSAQVTVAGSTGADGTYATLSAAFGAINAGSQTGNAIAIVISGNTTEPATGAVLNAGTWTSMTIQPSGGAWTITGATNAGVPLIDFNGADNVTVNGLNASGNALTIQNTTISTTAGTSTIRFVNDALSNVITNCTVLGSATGTASATLTTGTILFGGTNGTTGNDNNTISNNNIGDASSGLPSMGISSVGTSTALANDNITVTGNNIYNYFLAAGSNAVNVANSSAWTINNNRFYQTGARTGAAGYQKAIFISTASGGGYTINNNTIGYASSAGTGVMTYSPGTAGRVSGIDIAVANTPVSNIQGNTITAINLGTTSGAAAFAAGIFHGIIVNSGGVNIGTTTANVIGASSGTGAITITSTTNGGYIVPIFTTSTVAVAVQNNIIGSFTANGTAAIGYGFFGIVTQGTGTVTASGNQIGTSTANSIDIGVSGVTTGATLCYGIYNTNNSTVSITGNTMQNLNSYGSSTSSFAQGFGNVAAASTVTISNNTYTNITCATTGASGTFFLTPLLNTGAVTGTVNITNNTASNVTATAASCVGAFCFVAITSGSSTATLNINGNSFSNFTFSGATGGTGTSYGFYNATTYATTNMNNNTFNNLSLKTSGSYYLISNSSSTPNTNCNNNNIVTGFAKTVAGGTVFLYYNFGSPTSGTATIDGNNFSNITLTGATIFDGIEQRTTASQAEVITNNTINNVTTGSGLLMGIFQDYGATGCSVSGNTVSNFSTSGIIYGIRIGSSSASTSMTVNGNTVTNLASTGGSTCYGIFHALGTTTVMSRNKVGNISGTSASAVVSGIFISGGTTMTLTNNIVGDITAPATSGTTPVTGISITSGTTVTAYYNTVYLAATSTGTNFGTTGIHVSTTTPTLDFRNNLVVNNSVSNGTGLTVAFRRASTTLTQYSTNSNNNSWYAPILYHDGTNSDATLAAYKSRMGTRDQLAVSVNAAFISTTASSAQFLHIPAAFASSLESGGTAIPGLTIDYDGDVRPGPVASVNGGGLSPDIGADEFDGVPVDAQPPVITYTPLIYTCSTGDRTFTATITDVSGVPTSGILQPRVYFRKNALAWNSTQGVLTSGTAMNGTWTFTISAAAMGGLALSDVVGYYVIAQDVSPSNYISSNPSAGLVATDVNTVTTPPTTPNTYAINNALSGTYTVGVGGNYTTLTAAVNAYNTACLLGPVVFLLTDATYSGSETFPITVNQNPGASSVNTLTIRPQATSTITGSANNAALIRIFGNYVTIDGSNSSTTTRDLTIANTSTTGPSVILFGSIGTTPVMNSRLLNTIVINGVNTSSAVVVSDGTTLATAGYFSNITIQNNSVQRGFVGIYCIAVVQAGNGNGLLVSNNSLNTSGTNAIRRVGIYLQGVNGGTVSGNTIGNFEAATTEVDNAVWLATGTSNTVVSGNMISTMNCTSTGAAPAAIYVTSGLAASNITVSGNTITQISTAGGATGVSVNGIQVGSTTESVTIINNTIGPIINTSNWGANGILLGSTSNTANILVANNFVYDVYAVGYAGSSVDDNGQGIMVNSGAGYEIYYNTVRLTVNQSLVTGFSAAFMVSASVTVVGAINLRNNILVNTQTVGTDRYAIRAMGASNVFSAIDYNDYWAGGSNLGYIGSNRTNLAAVQAGFGSNLNSANALPVFTAVSDVHLVSGSNPLIEDKGVVIASITTDIDGQSRNSCSPDMGADEFGTPREINVTGNSVTIVDGSTVPSAADHTSFGVMSVCNGTVSRTYTIENTGGLPLTITSVTITGANAADFTVTTSPVSPVAAAGSTTLVVTFDPSAAGLRTAVININNDDCDEGVYDFVISGTGTQIALATASQTNVSCNGGNNGAASVTATGGVAPITYAWTPSGGNAASATSLAAGTYTCIATDANGCTAQVVVTITQPNAITVSNVSQTNVLCNGGNNGSATVTASGGTGTLTYAWTPTGGTAATATGLSAGTYTCTVTDANGCTGSAMTTITEPNAITASVTAQTNVACNGGMTGAATVTASGGTGALTYAWAPTGGNAATATGLGAGTYTCTITDANGCTNQQIAIITQPSPVNVVVASSTNVSCNGGNNGSATVTASGGTGTLTYAWTPSGGNAATASGLGQGTYTCTVTDASGCTGSTAVTITQPSVITASATQSNALCNGGTGSATVTAAGGTGSLTYAWAPTGGNAATASGLAAGTYTCTITDANGCTNQQIVTITQPSAITASTTQSNALCNGGTGSATVTASGGTGTLTYAWAPTGGNAATATGLAAATYTCTITDANGCTNQQVVTITQPSAITSSVVSSTNITCNGGNNGAATITASGGTGALTYAWAPTGGNAVTATGLTAGTYTCTITDANGCTRQQTVTITQPSAITSSVSSVTDATCGNTNGSITITASGGTGSLTYAWAPTGGNAVTASGLGAGTYTCTITDASGCTHQQIASVNNLGGPVVTVTSQTDVTCNGGSNGSATVSATGFPTLTYAWAPTGGNAATATGLTATNYTVTVTDGNGCIQTATLTITQPNAITSTVAQTNVSCNGGNNGSATVTASGGTGTLTYAWAPTGGTAATATNLTAQTYTCTITDASGCTRQQTVTITQPNAITSSISAQTSVSCNGGNNGSATVTASGGTGTLTYAWAPTGGTAATATNLTAQTYTCTITDVNGCTRQQTVTITQPSAITSSVSAQTDVLCNGGNNGSATITASGGTGALTYAWAPTGGNAATATGLTAQTYTCTITDANGCTRQQTVTITQPNAITSSVSAQTSVSCNGGNNGSATITASGGTGTLTYAWAPTGGNAATATGLTAQTYTCTIADANGCTRQQTVTITQPNAITSSISAQTSVSCNGGNNGSATVTASGGTGTLTYAWAPTGGTAATATNLTAQTYTCTITDANGCTRQQTVTITQPNAITSSISAQTSVSCNGGNNGSATVTASGGTGTLTYAWAPTGGNAATATGLTAQTYTCTITDANGCTRQQTVTITQPNAITSSISAQTSVSCNGGNNGSATVAASGGTGTLTYAWAPTGGNAATATNLTAQTYTCTITDANGCTRQQTVTITQPNAITSSISAQTSVSCNGGNNGSATVTASGGTGTLTYAWAPTGGNAATATNLTAQTYTCTITDANGCTRQQTVTITQPNAITSSVSAQTSVSCNGGNNGSATVAASGGTGTLTYAWAPTGGTAATATGLTAQTYTCTITDANGCTRQQTVTITQPNAITSSVSAQTSVSCNGGNNGSATVTASGGTGTLTYAWAPTGGNAATATNLTAQTYTCTITDVNGCTRQQTVTITQPNAITSSISAQTSVSCNGGNNGSATVTASGGTGTLTYAWAPTGGNAATATNLTAQTYTCTITDVNGCTRQQTVTITQPNAITSSISAQTSVSCNGGNNGSATVAASGGTGTLTYAWAPTGGNAATATNLTAQTYTCTITDANGCTRQQTVTITQPNAITSSISAQTSVSCNGGNNGSATVAASGGTGTLTYAWAPTGGNAATATGLTAQTYTCTITDVNGCTRQQTVTITQPNAITSSISAQTNVSCHGGNDGSATVTSAGGTGAHSYSWAPTGGNAATATGLSATTYTCTITDANGCTHAQVVNIVEPSPVTISVTASTNVTCFGGNNGSATVTASGGTGLFSYVWTPTGGNTPTATNLTAQTYTCTVTDQNGCSASATVAITQPALTTVNANVTANTVCFGTPVTFTGSGTATAYAWTGGVTDGVPFTPSVTDTYTVTGTDAAGCTNTATVTVTVNPLPTITANASSSAVCSGDSVTFTGSGSSVSYTWSGGVVDAVPFEMTTTGTFTVTGTDANGCVNTASVTVTVNPNPVVALGPDQSLCSTTATLDAQNPGSTYLWSDGSSNQTLVATVTGTYWVDVTSASGCTTRDSVIITIGTNPVVALGADTAICSTSLMLDAGNAGATYLWSDNTTAQTLNATATGTYYVTVTLPGGCFSSDTIHVTVNPGVAVMLGADTAQCGGSITLDAGAVMNGAYLWNDNTTAQTLTATASGIYYVVVTDSTTGCMGTDTINVTINSAPVVNLGADVVQCGGTVTLDAGPILFVDFLWNDNTTAQTLVATSSGLYYVTVTDTTGCTSSDSINVTINALPVVTFSLSQSTICEQDADLVLTGAPAGGSFSGPGVTGSNFDPSSLNGVQTITYTYTDPSNGCSASASANITVDPCTGISENGAVALGMNVYPNPNYGHFFIQLNYVPNDAVIIEVTNALGQVVKTMTTTSTVSELDITEFEGGVYNVRVIDGTTIFVGRIVKQ